MQPSESDALSGGGGGGGGISSTPPLEGVAGEDCLPKDMTPAGDVHHVKNNSGKKNGVVYTPVLSLGGNRYEILKEREGGNADEEVAGMVSRLVHYVSFGEATQTNSDLLLELEEYQEECWQRERLRCTELARRGSGSSGAPAPRSASKGAKARREAAAGGGGGGGRRDAAPSSSAATGSAGATGGGSAAAAGGGGGGSSSSSGRKPGPLEEELYFTHCGMSLQSNTAKGFQCVSRPDKAKARAPDDVGAPPLSHFTPVPASPADYQQDAFYKKLGELQYLQSETTRSEKVPAPKAAMKVDSDRDLREARTQTPPP